ncbi:hypothetical protein KI387_016026 [Taxus chinensis]|uniref:mitogen-activated protein kinase kinase n=1 Tax=Taxus chinensis TaxID=29808 RepID=A0AA38GD65_TAXCH|nr:hypothetical protein KI387_016026 [Taxus chinensis]
MGMATKKRLELKLPIPTRFKHPMPLPLPLPPKERGSDHFVLAGPVQRKLDVTSMHKEMAELIRQAQSSDLERLGILGHGSGGTVYKVLHRKSSSHYALKVVRLDHDRYIMREAEILKKINSPFIVKCEGIFEEGGSINFVLEYMDGGSLANLLKHKKRMSESFIANAAAQVLKGLKYLHGERIVHRDIKPSNLLMNRNSQVIKIADFGVSRVVSQSMDTVSCNSYVGTCAYMSPERFDPDSYGGSYNGYAGDVWSFGLSMLECYVGYFPFLAPGQKADWATLMCAICFGDPPCAPPGSSAQFRSFIGCCLQKDPSNRWTPSQLLNHPFLTEFMHRFK